MRPAQYHAAVQRTLRGGRLREIVDRWFQGAPCDLLAAELATPRDALWEALAPTIAAQTKQPEQRPPRDFAPVVHPAALAEPPARSAPAPASAPAGIDCTGPSCPYRCSSVCGRAIVNTHGTARGATR